MRAAADKDALQSLIEQNERFILKTASAASHRYITTQDDEWSVAVLAFSVAASKYEVDKGSFFAFAEIIIKRRLTDFYRSQQRYSPEIPVAPYAFDEPPDEDSEQFNIQTMVMHKIMQPFENNIRWEIEAINDTFKKYGFSFLDLSTCSPKADKTRKCCAKAVLCIINTPKMYAELTQTHSLPIKAVMEITSLPRKILERHRKYIIAACEIINGDYPYLAEYIKYIKEAVF